MRAATRLRTVVCRHSLQAAVAPIASCQWRSRNYATDSPTEAPKRRGRPRKTREENIAALALKARRTIEHAADEARFQSLESLKEEYAKFQEEDRVPMRPMRRPVGRPKGERVIKKRPVGRPKKRGRRYGSKNKPKEIGPKAPKTPKPFGRPKLIGPKYPTAAQKVRMAHAAGVPPSELVFGVPKLEQERARREQEKLEEEERNKPKSKTPRIRRTRAQMEADAIANGEILDPGRPKRYGPELPSQIIMDQGVMRRVYLRPGRAKLFFCEEERKDKEVRQAKEEIAKEVREQIRTDLAEYGMTEDGKKRRRKTPLQDEIATKLMKKQVNKQTGPKAYQVSELTQIARDFLAQRKQDLEMAEGKRDWEYPLDDEGHPILPKRTPGGNTRHKLRETPQTTRQSKWVQTPKQNDSTSQNWRLVTPKKIQNTAPTIAALVESGIPQPKPPTDKSLVIGEKKCADIFKGFDFSEYEGCEIIDFNPGYGVFSRELNRAIQPSKHILLEHEPDFIPFLERTCTDPSFEIIQKDFYEWGTFDNLVSSGKVNPKKVPFEDGINKTLLITGMLHKEVKGDRFMAQILDAIAQQNWVFKYGRIKFLLWVDEEMVARYLPRTFGRRNRAAVMVEAFTNVRELASPPPFYTWADHRFFFRMDIWNRPDHTPNKQDRLTGVKYAKQLTFINMPRNPPPVIFESDEFWPPLRWAQTTLLEFTPKLTSPYLRGEVPDSEPWKFFNLILTSTFLSRHTLMRQVLAKVGEGADQMLETEEELKKFPDLADKPAMHVSIEELEALAQAYEFWPWRSEDPFIGSDMRLSRPGMLDELEDAQLVV
ncbi:Mitochondrial transcription factor 1 [Arthrobotrys musiformis]|uniref:rRNA adenine N(6)-methyltransferase n=1 Tax=Arthrobotrys musiformis TaxID=47236 RepID=A0AAV9WKQ8_9PEZI